jgi:hypothetical protein
MDDTTRTRLGREGTRIIHEIEDALDQVIALQGQLVSFLPQARKDAGLSAVFGQGMFDHASDLLSDLTQARRRVISTHRSAEAVARMVGYAVVTPPDQNKPPPDGFVGIPEMASTPALRVVEKPGRAA